MTKDKITSLVRTTINGHGDYENLEIISMFYLK